VKFRFKDDPPTSKPTVTFDIEQTTEVHGMQRFVPQSTFSPREHHAWCLRMWNRMDRDDSQTLTRAELDCEEFLSVIKSVLNPNMDNSTGGALYSRAAMNIEQAINFCLRKADSNHNNRINFDEFKSFLWYLRQTHQPRNSANLIFALFDQNSNDVIEELEFREIYRFFAGRNPTECEFQDEWARLDIFAAGEVTRLQFIKWLESTPNPIFDRFSKGNVSSEASRGSDEEIKKKMRRSLSSGKPRPRWNQRFCTANPNTELPSERRTYFMRPHSLPQLLRHFDRHQKLRALGAHFAEPEPRRKSPILCPDCPPALPYRHEPGGYMRNRAGERTLWDDNWTVVPRQRIRPVTLDFGSLGPPPKLGHRDEWERD